MGADVLDLLLSASQLGCADLTCSLHMMLVMEGARKEKKGLEFLLLFLKNIVDLLKSPVATAYVDCTDCATCKRLCVEYSTFLRKATYCIRIERLLRVRDLLRTMYDLCARGALCVRCTSCARKAT